MGRSRWAHYNYWTLTGLSVFFICAICFHFCKDVLYLVQLNLVLAVKSFAILILGQLWPDKENS